MTCDGTCGDSAQAPADPVNPAGLTQIAYRVADFAGFRAALLAPLAGEQQLTTWAPGPGDLGLQVLEWWAYLGDILTFYNERIANNSYLRTAAGQPGPQGSAAALARLLGYLPAPAITATGVIAAIRGTGAANVNLVIPAGLQITSTPTADAPAQLFEAGETGQFTGPSDGLIGLPPDLALFGSAAPSAQTSQGSVLLAGHVTVTPGEHLVLVERGWDGTTPQWAVVTADSAVTQTDPNGAGNTLVTLESTYWQGITGDPTAVPPPATPQASDYQLQRATATALLWALAAGGSTNSAATAPAPSAASAALTLTVPLATVVRSAAPGDNVLFTGSPGGAAGPIQLLAQVTGYAEEVIQLPATALNITAAQPGVNVYLPRTNLTISVATAAKDVQALQSALTASTLGGISMHYGFRDVGELIPTPATMLGTLPLTVTVPAGLTPPEGPVGLQDANGAGLIVTTSPGETAGTVTLNQADGASGDLDSPLSAPIRLLANLVQVSRGATVPSEILGDGDPTAASQVFVLRHSPLIYMPPTQPGSGPVSSLTVSVDQVPWQEVRAFAGQAPDATVYVTTQLADGSTQVRCGDGINGARLPLGIGNVIATYRYGMPAPPPPAGQLSTLLQPQPNLGAARNPVDITPGTDPESASQTAAVAPGTVALLSGVASATPPLISLDDCQQLAATVSEVTRVRAYWTWDADLQCPAITAYVGSEGSTAAAVTEVNELFGSGACRVPLSAAPAVSVDLALSCELLCSAGSTQSAIENAVANALTGSSGLFSPSRMPIGQRLYRSQVEAALMVGGVVTVLGLCVQRAAPAGGSPRTGLGDAVLDPGQGGFFSLPDAELTVSVVIP